MQFALVDNISTEASPGLKGICPGCRAPLIAKCGDIKIWHWAHLSADCDPWHEPETAWHRDWKNCFPSNCREKSHFNHRADVIYGDQVFEFQHSSISPHEIEERENLWLQLYDAMYWIIDAKSFQDNFDFRTIETKQLFRVVSFRWKYPRKCWFTSSAYLLFDLGSEILEIKKLHDSLPCGGYGYLHPKKHFKNRMLSLLKSNHESQENRC